MISEKKEFRSNGKLLLSGEYLVLDGAQALAIPTKYGQSLKVESAVNNLNWKSYTNEGDLWLDIVFDNELNIIEASDVEAAKRLKDILYVARLLNPAFVEELKNKEVKTYLEFPGDWGLGSSSTLINNIAQWANIDPFELQQNSFPGSGYDIACAFNNTPILYSIVERQPAFITQHFYPSFYDKIFFVHLNKKQNSRDAIKSYKEKTIDKSMIETVSEISQKMAVADDVKDFKTLMAKHENLLSEVLGIRTVKSELFPDFFGSVKSLGAWGGDFVMAVGEGVEEYFKNKGYKTVIPFEDMIL